MTPDLAAQIRCIERELALRKRVYPRLLKNGTLTQHMAAHELLTMEAVLATLQALRAQQEVPDAATPD